LELNNGQWVFWVVAWAGGDTMNGTTRCARASANLNGADVQVAMTIDNVQCAHPDFSPSVSKSAGLNFFPKLNLYDCKDLISQGGFKCGTDESNAVGKFTTKRFILSGFRKSAGSDFTMQGGGLVSACRNPNDPIPEVLPLGSGIIPIHTSIQYFFSSSACDETDPKGFVKDRFEFGLYGTSKTPKKNPNSLVEINNGICDVSAFSAINCLKFGGTPSASCSMSPSIIAHIGYNACIKNGGTYNDSTSKSFSLASAIPDSVVCSEKRLDQSNSVPSQFASGDGSVVSPFVVCTEAQLNSIGSSRLSSSFLLLKDLDMNKTSIFGDSSIFSNCLANNIGMNFVPIGGFLDANCNPETASFYTGTFDGSNHSISNIRLNLESDYVGFIRKGGTIRNLILKNVDIEGTGNVGAFSGDQALNIYNVTVDGGKIRGNSRVGGIAGSYTGSTLNEAHAKNLFVKVKGTSAMTGGLIALAPNAAPITISRSSFEGLIEMEQDGIAGGLLGVGYIPTISESFSSGAMMIKGSDKAGGLVGSVTAGPIIVDSYSLINIGPNRHGAFLSTASGKIGGLSGDAQSGNSVVRSFYYGTIMLPCHSYVPGSNTCGVAGLSGGANFNIITDSFGALINDGWSSPGAGDTSLNVFETAASTAKLTSTLAMKDVGGPFPRLSWDNSPCSNAENNESVTDQYSSKKRGVSLVNPIILCHRKQLAEITNYPSLNYSLEDNISVGEINSMRISNFSGSIRGNGKILGGIFDVQTTTSNSGLIQINSGSISDVIFTNSNMLLTGTGTYGGFFGLNDESGVIKNNKFLSVNVINSDFQYQGIISGANKGTISNNKLSSSMKSKNHSGLVVGQNDSDALILGIEVNGDLYAGAGSTVAFYGGVAGINDGKIRQVETRASLHNLSSGGNSNSGSYFGGFVGSNSGAVGDILITPHVRMEIEKTNPQYGQVFGKLNSGSDVKRVLALNELY
ncbi:MAG: hypothetical protein K2Q18_00330, partial [Bdellovibrionales bacterium]|nr:hypothetical protein [Bdellovibrionales bacterium]